jgi:hypothetical protein
MSSAPQIHIKHAEHHAQGWNQVSPLAMVGLDASGGP